ncbi:MAG: SCO family protein [Rhodobiaceae bacterium]|jgi:protein SCO1/2|nr:SCO family protein [Rhodobiaceae bacterium]|tara:strand:+ start:368 stop:994 length:627 start_codon:yes stop_codon:yes gene_type:complete
MFQKYFLILLATALISFVLYLFGTFFISSNRSYNQDKVVTEVENQEGIPGGHFRLRTHDGKIFDTMENQDPMLIYFGFTYCPDVCPITLITMANVLDKLENKKITPIFITVDPERDNEEILSNYVNAFHDKIIGLTGSISEINQVTSDWKVYFKKENNIDMPDNYTVNHLDIIFIANKNAEFVDFIKPNTSSEDIIKKLVKVIPKIKG